MANNFPEQSKKSTEDFIKFILPKLLILLKAQKIQQVEGDTKGLMKDWDTDAGIDWWLVDNDRLRGIASRVQWCNDSWNTWTVRKEKPSGFKTEYAKRKEAIEEDWIYPYWTIQAYITQDRKMLISFAIIRTKDLIFLCSEDQVRVNPDGTKFYYVGWNQAEESGAEVIKYKNELSDSYICGFSIEKGYTEEDPLFSHGRE